MPVNKCPNGKWRIGRGKCIYPTKEVAERAYKGYLSTKWGELMNAVDRLEPRVGAIIYKFFDRIKKGCE